MGQVALRPALGLLVFVVSLCIAECRVIGRRIVLEMVSAAFGEALDQARHTSSPSPRAGAQDNFRRLDQDQGSAQLDMRQTIAVTCALDGGNYAH